MSNAAAAAAATAKSLITQIQEKNRPPQTGLRRAVCVNTLKMKVTLTNVLGWANERETVELNNKTICFLLMERRRLRLQGLLTSELQSDQISPGHGEKKSKTTTSIS